MGKYSKSYNELVEAIDNGGFEEVKYNSYRFKVDLSLSKPLRVKAAHNDMFYGVDPIDYKNNFQFKG